MLVDENSAASTSGKADAMGELAQDFKFFPLQNFKLYQTQSKFYMIGSDKNKKRWKVLKIDRLEPSELIITEDPTTYDYKECTNLLERLHAGNLSTGGLMLVTECYGIVGFIKFLEPYYMILITKRRKIGSICGHKIYRVSKSQIIRVAHSSVLSNLANSKDEQRYMKLLSMVDLTKDFFFSYTYHIMWSLQRNLTEGGTGHMVYERLFVWNEFLTRAIRRHLNNTQWTVALVYGFLKQAKIPLNGKVLSLTLIARRSRHYAGTRYLKRGVNDKGRVANDVETEQIVFEDECDGCPRQITSVVQNRGSIPLYWSQEASWLNLKPDIILHKKDPNYEATRLHFENLAIRYGKPIIVLNLVKAKERKPREAILCEEFSKAVHCINKTLSDENRLKYIHWDFHCNFRRNSSNVLPQLEKWASWALQLTGLFYSEIISEEIIHEEKEDCGKDQDKQNRLYSFKIKYDESSEKKALFQQGVLRTNCIDCLDRTNVAQYAFGLAALGRQLNALGLIEGSRIDRDSSLGEELMGLYEKMGDTLALQYGGSAAHNKVFSLTRGRWVATTHSQEFFRTLQRYYRNAYLDPVKQDAINVFLGHFQPQHGKPALWELDSDQPYNVGRHADCVERTDMGSLSDGSMVIQNSIQDAAQSLHVPYCKRKTRLNIEGHESTPECDELSSNQLCFGRSMQSTSRRQLFNDSRNFKCSKEKSKDTHFIDIDWFASSGNSGDDESVERCPNTITCEECSSENDMENETLEAHEFHNEVTNVEQDLNGEKNMFSQPSEIKLMTKVITITDETSPDTMGQQSPSEFSSIFDNWVHHGETWCH
eukprot:TRINITY_DN3098_c0_g1_i7.p1 TRINITY_DN3098_c0_g1~~TRINITY_DN3098_c0_g1_i7.p1  ORF type:complete len:822 (+),score=136.38 TRINITY_DN3098_c0_g1_i7:558-3023(+)